VDGDNGITTIGISMGFGGTNSRVVANNIIVNCAIGVAGGVSDGDANKISHNNLLFGNTANYSNWNTERNEFLVDPQFIDSANNDYRLKSTSPARNAAIDAGIISNSKSFKDLGAHQIRPPVRLGSAAGMSGGMRG